MATEKSLVSVQMLLVSAYLSCWYGGLLSYFSDNGLISYTGIGVLGAIVLVAASIVIIFDINPHKWLRISIVLFNIIPLILFIFSILPDLIVFPTLMLSSVVQGVLLGLLLQRSLRSFYLKHDLTFLLLGCIASMIPQFLSGDHFGKNKTDSSNGFEFWGITIFMILLLFVISALDFKIKSRSNQQNSDININPGFSGSVKFFIALMAGILYLIEITFYFWSVALIHDNQSLISKLTFPLTIILVCIFRLVPTPIGNRIENIGWLFALSVLLCVSLGMFYTFSFTPVFILGFGFSSAFLLIIHQRVFDFRMDTRGTAYLLTMGALVIVIVGLFIQNHTEFIRSINMPEDVIALSARQAVVKQLASFAGIAVIASGYLFLRRRTIFSQ